MTIQRRTFQALKYEKGSPERARLNCSPLTSEYMTSYKYVVCDSQGRPTHSFRTKLEAEIWGKLC